MKCNALRKRFLQRRGTTMRSKSQTNNQGFGKLSFFQTSKTFINKYLLLFVSLFVSTIYATPIPPSLTVPIENTPKTLTPAEDSVEEDMGEVDEDELIQEEENPNDDEGVTPTTDTQ